MAVTAPLQTPITVVSDIRVASPTIALMLYAPTLQLLVMRQIELCKYLNMQDVPVCEAYRFEILTSQMAIEPVHSRFEVNCIRQPPMPLTVVGRKVPNVSCTLTRTTVHPKPRRDACVTLCGFSLLGKAPESFSKPLVHAVDFQGTVCDIMMDTSYIAITALHPVSVHHFHHEAIGSSQLNPFHPGT